MTENTENEETEEVEINLDHPWHQAAMAVEPQPTPSSAKVEPVGVPTGDGQQMNAAMLTVVGINGVMTVFLPPKALWHLVQQADGCFRLWENKEENKIVVADQTMQKSAQEAADFQQRMEEAMRKNNGTA